MRERRRNKERNRAQGLVVDPTTALDLREVTPLLPLGEPGEKLWDWMASEPPFWWDPADVPAFMVLCKATDTLAEAFQVSSPNAIAAMMKEWRSLAGELGITCTARGRLKLTEAQGVAAARKAEQLERDGRQAGKALSLEDLGVG